MWREQVNPQQARFVPLCVPPFERATHGLIAGTLGRGKPDRGESLVLVVVVLETPRQAVASIEWERGDERCGGPAVFAQDRGERRDRCVEPVAGIVVDAVFGGKQARQDRRMRGQRDHRVSVCEVEDPPCSRESIEGGRLDLARSRKARGIVPPGVDRDEDDVAAARGIRDRRSVL